MQAFDAYPQNNLGCGTTFDNAGAVAVELLASLRFLARRKAVATIAVLTMACALGVNTSALSVLRAFLVSGLGVPEPDRVVHIAPIRELPGRGDVVFSDAFPNYEMIRDSKRTFGEVGVVLQNLVSWRQGTDVRALQNTRASASFFKVMRLAPVLGRTFTPDEEGPSPAPVVVVSHALWTSAFSQDRGVIGRVITLDGAPTTVIGVMPEGFAQPAPTDVWTPFDLPANLRSVVAGGRTLTVFARMADGVPPATAAAEVAEFTRRSHAASRDNRDYRYRMDTLRDQLLAGAESTVVLIQVAAACLLLLAVLNLVSLLVAWGFERHQEMAVRRALGGGQGQVFRLLVAQSALIVGAGFVVGVGLSQVLLALLRQVDLGPQLGFFMRQARMDLTLLILCIPVVVLLAILSGFLPAVVGPREGLARALRSSSRSASHSTSAMRLQRALVVIQAALSVVVLASATVVGLSFRNLSAIPDGFATDRRVVARLVLPDEHYASHARRVALADALLAALQREPALAKAAFTSTLPVNDVRWGGRFFVPDASGAVPDEPILFHFRRIAPGYPPAMGLPLLRGRLFTAGDDSASPRVALISRATAEQFWPNENPIGRQILRAGTGSAAPVPFEIVGVIGDAMDGGYQAPKGQAVYVPFAQVSGTRLSIVVEGKGGTAETVAAIKRAVNAADPMLAASGVATLQSLVSGANALPQLRASILGLFALAAVLIAALGSYGVMRQLVGNREREFAVRLVFGAVPRDLAREVLLQLARLTVPGVIAGLGGAWIAANLLRTFVFGVDPRSVSVLVAVSLGVLAVAALAALPSILRAMRLDPKETMS